MLLLLIDSFLLIFITLGLGILTHFILEKAFRDRLPSDTLGIFLLGLISSTVYFNALSFNRPVNYFSLVPLTVISFLVTVFLREKTRQVLLSIRQSWQFIFSAPCRPISICLFVLLFFYWIIPPGNADSWIYHYDSIRWYEKFKVVPGLANIDGRYAFNPAAFIIQSAYSFTGPAGQSLYPLNGVLLGLFFSWLLIRLLEKRNSPLGLIYGGLMAVLFTPLLIDISSPTSDGLVAVCTCYPLICLFRLLRTGTIRLSGVLVPCVIILYSLTAKLSSFPVLLALPYIFFLLPRNEKRFSLLFNMAVIAGIIYIPWLARNYILSGYAFYPFPHPDLFHPDWKAPVNLTRLETYYITVQPKTGDHLTPLSAPLPPSRWLRPWLATFFQQHTPLDPVFVFASILSPFGWVLLYFRQKKIDLRIAGLWLVVYAGVWAWFLTSPILRFGAILMALSLFFPAFLLFSSPPRISGFSHRALQWLFLGLTSYYILAGFRKPTTYAFSPAGCWLYPLKDRFYDSRQHAGFPYTTFPSTGIKLYRADQTHKCINADLPCIQQDYGEINMRGEEIEDGFRITKDEILLHYPFIQ